MGVPVCNLYVSEVVKKKKNPKEGHSVKTSTPQSCQGHEKQENSENCHSQEVS